MIVLAYLGLWATLHSNKVRIDCGARQEIAWWEDGVCFLGMQGNGKWPLVCRSSNGSVLPDRLLIHLLRRSCGPRWLGRLGPRQQQEQVRISSWLLFGIHNKTVSYIWNIGVCFFECRIGLRFSEYTSVLVREQLRSKVRRGLGNLTMTRLTHSSRRVSLMEGIGSHHSMLSSYSYRSIYIFY